MQVVKYIQSGTVNNPVDENVLLVKIPINGLFRFVADKKTFEEAMETYGSSFFRVIAPIGPAKTGEVTCISLDSKDLRLFNDNHLVIPHEDVLAIKPAKKVDISTVIEDKTE